jgi:hypothetical protein
LDRHSCTPEIMSVLLSFVYCFEDLSSREDFRHLCQSPLSLWASICYCVGSYIIRGLEANHRVLEKKSRIWGALAWIGCTGALPAHIMCTLAFLGALEPDCGNTYIRNRDNAAFVEHHLIIAVVVIVHILFLFLFCHVLMTTVLARLTYV